MTAPTVLIVARAPVPGEAKTRLAAAVGDDAAALVAAAALRDTIDAAESTGWPVCVALTGDLARAPMAAELSSALERHHVVEQRGDDFAERLAAAHVDADRGAGVVQIGMDTPQADSSMLRDAGDALHDHDAALGGAKDGGWWLLGVRDPHHADCLRSVPMSTPRTGERTLEALRRRGARVAEMPPLTDVDTWDDALEVGAYAPDTRFAAVVERVRVGDVA